ncbi:hypothetical protein C5C04_10630 [Rathayibacter rathayi]|uniref:Uncharacterized protein n=2 Tax=Rathayibacter rathayi TaxID=33887 RepID=A0ABD6W787_RATRA|nr:hypothetical protein C5C04_10630 [Rathayibacter rathayi]
MTRPRFIPLDRPGRLATGTPYQLMYLEAGDEHIAVRFIGLMPGAGRELSRTRVALRDERGGDYPFELTLHGGQIVPEEAIFSFAGPLGTTSQVDIILGNDETVIETIDVRPAPVDTIDR